MQESALKHSKALPWPAAARRARLAAPAAVPAPRRQHPSCRAPPSAAARSPSPTRTMGGGGSAGSDERVQIISDAIRVIPDFPKVPRRCLAARAPRWCGRRCCTSSGLPAVNEQFVANGGCKGHRTQGALAPVTSAARDGAVAAAAAPRLPCSLPAPSRCSQASSSRT